MHTVGKPAGSDRRKGWLEDDLGSGSGSGIRRSAERKEGFRLRAETERVCQRSLGALLFMDRQINGCWVLALNYLAVPGTRCFYRRYGSYS